MTGRSKLNISLRVHFHASLPPTAFCVLTIRIFIVIFLILFDILADCMRKYGMQKAGKVPHSVPCLDLLLNLALFRGGKCIMMQSSTKKIEMPGF